MYGVGFYDEIGCYWPSAWPGVWNIREFTWDLDLTLQQQIAPRVSLPGSAARTAKLSNARQNSMEFFQRCPNTNTLARLTGMDGDAQNKPHPGLSK
jgi:hypothetical protein